MLKVYTHHGKSFEVPNFIGLTEADASTVAKQKKLRYEVYDSVFVPEAIPGTVIVQYPERGYRVKQKRTIYLTMSAIQPEKVMLPHVVNVSLREAESRLVNAGLQLGRLEYRPNEYRMLVMDKSLHGMPLPDDTMLIKGTSVDLVVGKGLSNEVTQIPDLFSYAIKDAKLALYAVGLNLGALIYDNSCYSYDDSIRARVWKQNPRFEAGSYRELGTSVDIWLTVDEEKLYVEPEEIIPDTENENIF
ncbi:MAG: PASTA domain-containing protein [Prolixibacteraceae bacterium]